MRILVLSSRIPYPLTAGFRIRIYNTGKYLKEAGHIVDILQLTNDNEIKIGEEKLRAVFNKVITIKIKKREVLLRLFAGLVNWHLPFQILIYQSKEYKKQFDHIVKDYDIILCNHIRMAEYVKHYKIKKILDMHDAVSYNYENAVKNVGFLKKFIYKIEWKRVLKYEIKIGEHFTKSVIISEKDKQYLHEKGAYIDNMHTIPVAVRDDIKNRKQNYYDDENSLCFLGKLSYQPNEDAVIWFVNHVFKSLKKKIPDIQFYIIGIEPTPKVRELAREDGVTVTGFMENPYALIEKCKLMVAPIRNGAGIQNKVLESMVVGTPVIISPIVAEGIMGQDGEDFFIARTDEEYISLVTKLFNDVGLRETVGQAARQFVLENYSWQTLKYKWAEICKKN